MSKIHAIKVGKGKHAQIALECYAYPNRGGSETYGIRHAPTGRTLGNGYLYLTIARTIAKSLAESLSLSLISQNIDTIAGLFTPTMRDYLEFYSLRDTKHASSLEEFANGPDYAAIIAARNMPSMAKEQGIEYEKELREGPISPCYVAHPGGRMSGFDLESLVSGDPLAGEEFPSFIDPDTEQ